jgi:hypothetical protein
MESLLEDTDIQGRSESAGHWRCLRCKPSITYFRDPDGMDQSPFWTCCQCGFGMNSFRVDAGCSYCINGLVINDFNALEPAAIGHNDTFQDPYSSSLGFPLSANELETSEYVVCFPETVDNSLVVKAAADLTSSTDNNLRLFDSYFERSSDPFNYSDDFEVFALQSAGVLQDAGMDVSTIASTPCPPGVAGTTICVPPLDAVPSPPKSRIKDDFEACSSYTQTFQPNSDEFENLDSGYGTMTNGLSNFDDRSVMGKRKLDDTDLSSNFSLVTDETSILASSKRRRKVTPGEPRLACPFFKRNPSWCTNKACAGPGYTLISGLKQHLEQTHLQYRCGRCKATFRGKESVQNLENHRRIPEGCSLQQEGSFWGIDQYMLGTIKSRKGMTREQRWKDLYRLVFKIKHDGEVPSPCKFTPLSSKRMQLTLFSIDVVHEIKSNDYNRNLVGPIRGSNNHWSPDLLHRMHDGLSSGMNSAIRDDNLRSQWKSFAATQLYDILERSIKDALS